MLKYLAGCITPTPPPGVHASICRLRAAYMHVVVSWTFALECVSQTYSCFCWAEVEEEGRGGAVEIGTVFRPGLCGRQRMRRRGAVNGGHRKTQCVSE